MSMLGHIQRFAMRIAEDGHGYGRHVGDLTMRLPERQWMALVAEVCERAKYAPLTVATPRSMYEPLTIATSYGFNVVVEGPAYAQPAAYVCKQCGELDCTKNHAEFM